MFILFLLQGDLILSDLGLAEKRVYHAALNGNCLPRVLHPKDEWKISWPGAQDQYKTVELPVTVHINCISKCDLFSLFKRMVSLAFIML